MHPRNRNSGRYDLPRLAAASPALAPFLRLSPRGEPTVDFADPAAVKALNAALLKDLYGLEHWDVPPGYLSPPVPGRSDHLHYAADLLAPPGGEPPRGPAVRVLDVGVGANCIYPIVGRGEYGWSFVGTDVDPAALRCAEAIVAANPLLRGSVELRRQTPPAVLAGVVRPGERFDLAVCNPPFHASLEEARAGTRRKWENLGRAPDSRRNFGGQGGELWCPGGEAAFTAAYIRESAPLAAQFGWFTVLLSKAETLPRARAALARAGAADVRVVEMSQGHKRSRLLAWTYRGRDALRAGA